MRLIDADALKDNMFGYAPPEMTWNRGDIEHKIDEMPTIEAEPEEVPAQIGEIEWDTQFVIASCGECGRRLLGRSEDITTYFKYCPACGRKVKWDETN